MTPEGERLIGLLRNAAAKPHILLRDLPEDWLHADILTIEQRSAARERERLLVEHLASHDDGTGWCQTCTLLAGD